MSIFKRLFGGGKQRGASFEPMRGGGAIQTQSEKDATRVRMEKEMADQKASRDAASDDSETSA